MANKNRFLAQILANGARSYAAYATDELLSQAGGAEAGSSFENWQNCLAGRVHELAASVDTERPGLFVAQIQWATSLLVARGVEAVHFEQALQCLRKVLAEELPEQARPLALEYLDKATNAFAAWPDSREAPLDTATPNGQLAAAYLVNLLEGNRRKARDLLIQRADAGQPISELYTSVLIAAQREIGRLWHAGDISIAEEHFATASTKLFIAHLAEHAQFKPPNNKTAVAATPSGNEHDLGILVVSQMLEFEGWSTVFLGPNLPTDEIVRSLNIFRSDLLVLSAALTVHLPVLRGIIEAVRQEDETKHCKVLVGGSAFQHDADLAIALGADGFGRTASDAIEQAARWI